MKFFLIISHTLLLLSSNLTGAEGDNHETPSFRDLVLNNAPLAPIEQDALKQLFHATAGSKWINKNGWDSLLSGGPPSDPCTWFGVNCSAADQKVRHVHLLRLRANNLQGSLPASAFSNFSAKHLRDIVIDKNKLFGPIPNILSVYSNLQTLDVSHNSFSGTIPSSICTLNLLRLHLSENRRLIGTVPSCLGKLSKMLSMTIGYNRLSGTVPMELCTLTRLKILGISHNNLVGSVPTCLKKVNIPGIVILFVLASGFFSSLQQSIQKTQVHSHTHTHTPPLSFVHFSTPLLSLSLTLRPLLTPIHAPANSLSLFNFWTFRTIVSPAPSQKISATSQTLSALTSEATCLPEPFRAAWGGPNAESRAFSSSLSPPTL